MCCLLLYPTKINLKDMNQVVENVGAFIMIISIFLTVAWVIISAFNYSLKKKLIDLGHIDDSSLRFLQRPPESKLQNIKWALLFFFGGLGLIVCEYIPYNGN